MRRKKQPSPENHERWMVSYADFVTLLFAFFVVMFASAQGDKGAAKQVSESVKNALENGNFSAVMAAVLGGAIDNKGQGNAQMRGPGGANTPDAEKPSPPVIVELLPSLKVLTSELKKEIESGKIQVSMESRGLAVSFKEAAAFPSGTDEITPDAYESIGKVAAAITKITNPVRLEGHTDSVPIHNVRFRSNWDLSAARAISMLTLLADRFSIPTARMSVGGYAETAPIESNETDEGRKRNRRVDIIILNETGVLGEPGARGAAKPAPVPPKH